MPDDTPTAGVAAERIPALLQQHAIAPTAQRVTIATLMLGERQHLSADQVLARVNAAGTVVSKATVYNTLGLFAERGLISQVIVDAGRVFYDSNVEPHHHFYNVDDGLLTDVDPAHVVMKHLPNAPAGTELAGVDVVIRVRNQS